MEKSIQQIKQEEQQRNTQSYKDDFEINKIKFDADGIEEIQDTYFVSEKWPIVYILNDNGVRQAYIGETIDAYSRLSTHLNTSGKSQLKQAHIISSRTFNKSVALDIESYLIRYIQGDGQFKLLNGNEGLIDHSYYKREEYYNLFQKIWDNLRSKGIAKHSLEHINNSDLFKYSPYKSLTEEQSHNLMTMIDALLSDDKKSILVEGSAGTGKTILAIFLFKLMLTTDDDFNYGEFREDESAFRVKVKMLRKKYPNPKMGLVIAMSSFRQTIKSVFRNVDGLNADMVIGPSDVAKGKFDILFVDEAHRLRKRVNLTNYKSFDDAARLLKLEPKETNELEWVEKQSKRSLYFYDPLQSIKPSDIDKEVFDQLKSSYTTQTIQLKSQFRARGGNGYEDFVKNLLNQTIDDSYIYHDQRYDVLLFDNFHEFVASIRTKNEEHQLSRFVAGYGWEWASKNDKSQYDIEIEGLKFQWNHTNINYITEDADAQQVGCIHTTQGYDLNYTGIIFGPEIILNPKTQEIEIIKENYHDKNGLNTIRNKPEVLKEYIINIYSTIMLRGIMGCYIYVVDDNLREYFRKHMHVYKDAVAEVEEIETPEIKLIPYENSVPLYSVKVAAGEFFLNEETPDMDLHPVSEGTHITQDHFACKIYGNSMNKIVEDGQIALFKKYRGGSRDGKMVLVEYYNHQDPDFNSAYTFKEYYSQKRMDSIGWGHERIILKPRSYDSSYKEIEITPEDVQDNQFNVIGVFEKVLN